MRFLPLALLLVLTACATTPPPAQKDKTALPLTLKPASFSDLPGWEKDNIVSAIPALEASCARIMKVDPAKDFSALKETGSYASWQRICTEFQNAHVADDAALRDFFEHNFQPFLATAAGDANGLFTGYYEASLNGSRTRSDKYRYPLYSRPDDLVMVDLGEFRKELKGQRIAGRVKEGQLKPYETREQIVTGQWPHNDKVLVWVDDPVDAFFIQIQGSGVVELEEGGVMRIGYAGQNGHIYYAIGRELIARGELTKNNVSMQAIREWLASHPDQADEIMNTNQSYVFFTEMPEGPKGAEGVVLTPQRSMAIDRTKLSYGTPLWLDVSEPVPGAGRLQRLVMAQDTGGAIQGAVRGDFFWGYGIEAEAMAGPMKSDGRYWLLLPK